MVVDLLELGVLRRRLGIHLHRRRVARVQDRLREGAQLRAARYQAPQRGRVLRVVLGHHPGVSDGASGVQCRLEFRRQRVVGLAPAEVVQRGTAFPPARVVVELGDLVEAELFVVVGTDPFRGVDRALLERRVDVAGGDLLRHESQLRHDLARESPDAHLEPLEVGDGLDLLAEPAAHLRAGVAAQNRHDAEILDELVVQRLAAANVPPGVVLPLVEPERNGGAEGEGRVLAEVVVRRGVAALDGAGLHGIGDLQSGHDLARREHLDLELAAGDVVDGLGGDLRRRRRSCPAISGSSTRNATSPARRPSPPRARQRRRSGWGGGCLFLLAACRERKCGGGDTCLFQEGTTFHGSLLV